MNLKDMVFGYINDWWDDELVQPVPGMEQSLREAFESYPSNLVDSALRESVEEGRVRLTDNGRYQPTLQ